MGQLTEFSALGGDECTTPFLRASSDFSNVSHHEKHRGRKRQHIIGVILSINICWSIALLYYSLAVDRTGSCLRDCECQNELTTSPLSRLFELKPVQRQFRGSIRDDGSLFRKGPSDEVDAAWSQIAFDGYELVNVTKQDIIASGKDPRTSVRWEESIDAYPAQIEFAHQIHCLNEIRKEIWGERYFGNLSILADDAAISRKEYDPLSNDDLYVEDENHKKLTLKGLRRLHRQHTMHCLHMTLQNIMCNVDVGIITHNWVPGNPHIESPLPRPQADFSIVKTCKDFSAATDWIHQNAVRNGSARFESMKGLPDIAVLRTNDSYWP